MQNWPAMQSSSDMKLKKGVQQMIWLGDAGWLAQQTNLTSLLLFGAKMQDRE